MTLRRFVRADGWERWLDVPDPPPRNFLLRLVPPPARSYAEHAAAPAREASLPSLVFNREPWRVGRDEEPVFVEEGCGPPTRRADLFGEGRPSLHRERLLRARHEDLVGRLREILAETYDGPSVLGEALSASHALDKIRDVMRAITSA